MACRRYRYELALTKCEAHLVHRGQHVDQGQEGHLNRNFKRRKHGSHDLLHS